MFTVLCTTYMWHTRHTWFVTLCNKSMGFRQWQNFAIFHNDDYKNESISKNFSITQKQRVFLIPELMICTPLPSISWFNFFLVAFIPSIKIPYSDCFAHLNFNNSHWIPSGWKTFATLNINLNDGKKVEPKEHGVLSHLKSISLSSIPQIIHWPRSRFLYW